MMKLKPGMKKASKKQLRKAIKNIVAMHNENETQMDKQLKISLDRIEELKQRLTYQAEKYDDLEKEVEIRTSHTADLLQHIYS